MALPPPTRQSLARLFGDEPTRKIAPGVARTTLVEVTEERACAMARRLPVTRLADLTPLDTLGVPVYCAVTPLARDLTTHLGKGRTHQAARVSALLEAWERVCAEAPPRNACRMSCLEMQARGACVVDPARLDLPPDTRYSADAIIGWSPALEIHSDSEVWLPTDLVICPPQDGVISQPDTNGLAAGNTRIEAVLHGLCEVIERDAMAHVLFADLFAAQGDRITPLRRIDLDTVPEGTRAMVGAIKAQGQSVAIYDITTEIGVPTIRAAIADPAYPSEYGTVERRFVGLGCDPDAAVAVSRALTEAVQSRLAIIQGARDSFNLLPATRRAAAHRPAPLDRREETGSDFALLQGFASEDLVDDLLHVLDALSDAGFRQVLVADLGRDSAPFPVVRVRVPGLSSFFVDRSRIGWRDLKTLV